MEFRHQVYRYRNTAVKEIVRSKSCEICITSVRHTKSFNCEWYKHVQYEHRILKACPRTYIRYMYKNVCVPLVLMHAQYLRTEMLIYIYLSKVSLFMNCERKVWRYLPFRNPQFELMLRVTSILTYFYGKRKQEKIYKKTSSPSIIQFSLVHSCPHLVP